MKWANKEFQAAVTQGQKTDNAQMKNKCFKQLGDCQERIKEKTEALSQLQTKMAKLSRWKKSLRKSEGRPSRTLEK